MLFVDFNSMGFVREVHGLHQLSTTNTLDQGNSECIFRIRLLIVFNRYAHRLAQ